MLYKPCVIFKYSWVTKCEYFNYAKILSKNGTKYKITSTQERYGLNMMKIHNNWRKSGIILNQVKI